MSEKKQGMDVQFDEHGYLIKVGTRFAPCRGITLNAYNNQMFLHLNDSSKCYGDNGTYDKNLLKSLSMKWEYAVALKEAIAEAGRYAEQIMQEQGIHPGSSKQPEVVQTQASHSRSSPIQVNPSETCNTQFNAVVTSRPQSLYVQDLSTKPAHGNHTPAGDSRYRPY